MTLRNGTGREELTRESEGEIGGREGFKRGTGTWFVGKVSSLNWDLLNDEMRRS